MVMTNGLSSCNHLDKSTFILRAFEFCDFDFLFHFSMKIIQANIIVPDGMTCSTA